MEKQKKPKNKARSPNLEDPLKEIVALCKRRGFVFPGSEVYGGLSNTFDYGPYGVELLRNLKNEWWYAFVNSRDDVLGLDSSIILHSKVWEASGHLDSFNDPLVDCKNCRGRVRADQYLEEQQNTASADLDLEEIKKIFQEKGNDFACPHCGKKDTFTEPRQFNLMFATQMGSVSGSEEKIYLRPETAQGIFINFRNIVDSCRVKLPFGVAQIGKSFRNEIVARQFIFRTREFEQLEMEFFCMPGTQKKHFEYWVDFCSQWLYGLGINKKNVRIRRHEAKELSFYSEDTVDIEYKFPFGWGELWGIASRTDYDLKQHSKHSNKKLSYFDAAKNESYLPYVVEPALGLNRLFLAVMSDAYQVDKADTKEQRVYLKLHPRIAPVKAGIFPLQKKDGLFEIARSIYSKLCRTFAVDLDYSGSIGKRYYRQDELGTPFCFTVDYQTKEDHTVTVRYRDDLKQERIAMDQILSFLNDKLNE